jgi:hypothetical protein
MLVKTRTMLALAALGAVAVIIALVSLYRTPPNNTVTLVLNATVGDQPLVFNKFIYTNPGGVEKFRIRDFRFFVSNIKLSGKGTAYIETDSYHVARFDNSKNEFEIVLKDVELTEVKKITLSIGVDAKANTSLTFAGDLDPNSQMAWNWKVGYKFVLLEGGIRINEEVRPLVYHVGFSENRRDFVFDAPDAIPLSNGKKIRFAVDAMKLFTGTSKINMAELQSIKFDKSDARLFAENYKTMIVATWE